MRLKFILFFVFISILSCKTIKERKACYKLTSENQSLGIKSFDELKEYTGTYWVKLLDAVWILDGEVGTEDEIKHRISEKRFDILKVELIEGDSIQFVCKRVPLYVLISTNNCLNRN
ncbi:hypothetical protein CJ739_1998 [Mariniflexile rhizosphaerae]|uniref:hypothetical protein n=1 Tax=unclassified Mariniflexile TaxID=2643887 RepID=UPI000E32E6B4|nr:hypothetical protein [Mariniflexile sp. TRM1-10]AXP81081.1 hypothetical protein CJ739_1998 [Mariniflexile sp. TRM1-10]